MVIYMYYEYNETFTDYNYNIFHKWILEFQRNFFQIFELRRFVKRQKYNMEWIRVLEFG